MKKITCILFILTLAGGCRQNPPIRFAFFSDTHVAEYGSGTIDLRLAVRDVNATEGLDFVIVSGDITDTNTGGNLALAKQILDSLKIPYHIIPGNHDTKWSGSGGANFKQLWGADSFVFDSGGYRFIGFHQGPVLRMGDGHIPVETLTWLQSTLKSAGPNMPVILVMHYDLSQSVDNWYECFDILKDYNIMAILHGHGHRNRFLDYQGIPGFMGRSTLRGKAARGGYNIVEIRNDTLRALDKNIGNMMLSEWAAVSLHAHSNAATVADSLLPCFDVNDIYDGVKLKWLQKTGFTTTASPVCDSKRVYIGDASGCMYAFSLDDGRIIWEFGGAGAILGSAGISDSFVVYTSVDSCIYCLDSNDGSLIWQYKTNNALVSVPVIEEDVVYFGSSDGIFRSLNMLNGDLLWEFEGVGGYVETKPLLLAEIVVFGAWDGKLYALNKINGEPEWIWSGPNTRPLYSPAACWPVGEAGKIYIAAPDRYVSCIDANTGDSIWRSNRWKFRETIGASNSGDMVFARSMTDSVIAFNSRTSSAEVLWARDFGYGYDIAPSMPQENNGTLFWGTKNGLIIAAEVETGRLKWKHKFDNYLINTVCPVNEKNLVFSNIDGNVGLLEDGSL